MTKTKQAERILIGAGYSIRYNHYKGKTYPYAEKPGEHHSDSTLIKLCKKIFPDVVLN